MGQWQHLAATFDGTTARYYVNGLEVASRAVSGSVGNANTWRIGAYGSTPGGFFDGVIDEIRVYDRALALAEIQADRDQPLGIADPGAPTAPGNLTVTGNTQTSVSLSWTASTDDNGVAGYTVYSDGAVVGHDDGDVVHGHRPRLLDEPPARGGGVRRGREHVAEGGRQRSDDTLRRPHPGSSPRTRSRRDRAASPTTPPGTAATGAITGASWAAGRNGGGLSFDGVDDHVSLGVARDVLQHRASRSKPGCRRRRRRRTSAIVGTWSGSGPMLWVDHLAGHNYLTLGSSLSSYLDSGQSPATGQWQHLAATYDGTVARYYVDGVEVAARATSGSVGTSNVWRIGAYGGTPGGFFDGLVDDVRIYNRALSAGEVQFDRDHGVVPPATPPDTTPPSQPGTLTATPGVGAGGAVLGRRDRQRRRRPLQGAPLDEPRASRPAPANLIAQPTGTSYTDTGLAAASTTTR